MGVIKDDDSDHYEVLGLGGGEEGAKLSQRQIAIAYKKLALVLHPDKRPNHPQEAAAADFRRLKLAYDTLSDETSRRLYHQEQRAKERQKEKEKRLREEGEKIGRDKEAKINAELARILREWRGKRRRSNASDFLQDRVVQNYFKTLANPKRHHHLP